MAVLPTDIATLGELDLHLYGRICERSPAPPELRSIPGEISIREGSVLCALAARVWNGQGNVLELGTLFGASTQWLGVGMANNPARGGRLIAADAFLPYFSPEKTAEQLQPLLGAHRDWPAIEAGFEQLGFRRAFEALHAEGQRYSAFLSIRRCYVPSLPGESHSEIEDLAQEASPIGLLFVDSVKTWYPIRAMALALAAELQPGALVAWQDHRWPASFGIPFLNARAGETMQLLAIADGMHVYRYRGGLSSDQVARVMPETTAEVPADQFRALFRELAWDSYVRNDAYGVLSATLQLAFALATQGRAEESWALFDSARGVPGFGAHDDLFAIAQSELEALAESV